MKLSSIPLSALVLSLILAIAGICHFLFVDLFLPAMPSYIPYHTELIYLTGFIELILAAGICLPKLRSVSAKICAVYFIAILPAHIHVSLNRISMFGIDSAFLLWTRTVLQFGFVYWAIRISRTKSPTL